MQYQQSETRTADGCRILSLGLEGKDLESLTGLLRSHRCHLAHTMDGMTGIEMLHQAAMTGNPFQLVLLDSAGLNIEIAVLVGKINAHPLLRGIKIAVLGSYSGITGGLSKPLDLSQVSPLLERTLQDKVKHSTGSLVGKPRVLVVEDHPMNQKVIEIMLTKMGYQVDIASDGLIGLDFLANVPYDVVMMDIKLPEMDGISVVRALRNHQAGELNFKVPIIGVTALASAQDRAQCLEVGMNDYLSKPFHRADLASILDKWCPIETPSAS